MHREGNTGHTAVNIFASLTLLCVQIFDMRERLRFSKQYFLLTILFLITEILIAIYVHDSIIRPYIGDLLVVILIYCFFKSFLNIRTIPLAIGVLLFSYVIEILQYFHFIKMIGLQRSFLARVILGTSFAWADMVAYTVGMLIVIAFESRRQNRILAAP